MSHTKLLAEESARKGRGGPEPRPVHSVPGGPGNRDLLAELGPAASTPARARAGTEPAPEADRSAARAFDSVSGAMLSPMSAAPAPAPALSSGPVQAKKGKEPPRRPTTGNPVMEEYRPLMERTPIVGDDAKAYAAMSEEERAVLTDKLNNMDYRFQALKQGGDQQALFDFMQKASSLAIAGKSGFGFDGPNQFDMGSIFTSGLSAMMSDPLFASDEFKTHLRDKLAGGHEQFGQRLLDYHKMGEDTEQEEAEKTRVRDAMYADPAMHDYLSAVMAQSGAGQIGSAYDRDGSFTENNLSPEAWATHRKAWVNFNGRWDHAQDADTGDYLAGHEMFGQDLNDVSAPMAQMPQLPEGVLNYGTYLEKQDGVPLAPKRRRRFRRRR